MNSYVLDSDQFDRLVAVLVRQRNRWGTSQPETDERTGLGVYDVFVSAEPARRGDFQPDPQMLKVRVLSREAPAVPVGQAVRLVNLRATNWTNDSGKSGTSLSAERVEAVTSKSGS